MEKIIFGVFTFLLVIILTCIGGSVGVFSSSASNSSPAILSLFDSLEGSWSLGRTCFLSLKDDLHEVARALPPQKEIQVSLGKQILTLWENGRVVRTFPTLTGQMGMETPPGTYSVLSKYSAVTMQGAIGTPLEYRVENVPWVLFFIDHSYAIHGNYWKSANNFGKDPSYTGSHGCVGLLPEEAKYVFNWAEVGTKIVIEK